MLWNPGTIISSQSSLCWGESLGQAIGTYLVWVHLAEKSQGQYISSHSCVNLDSDAGFVGLVSKQVLGSVTFVKASLWPVVMSPTMISSGSSFNRYPIHCDFILSNVVSSHIDSMSPFVVSRSSSGWKCPTSGSTLTSLWVICLGRWSSSSAFRLPMANLVALHALSNPLQGSEIYLADGV